MIIPIKSREEFVQLKTTQSIVVIDFYAQWCGPCKSLAPLFEDLSLSFPDIPFIKVDIDEFEDIAEAYKVSCVPTIIILFEGEPVKTVTGGSLNTIKEVKSKLLSIV